MNEHLKIKYAFTLAEVLITIGIIGVVAALTIPTVIANYQKKQTIEKLKSTYTLINNAIEMAKVDYGLDVNSWDIPEHTDGSAQAADYFAEHYLIPYLKVTQDCRKDSSPSFCNVNFKALNDSDMIMSSATYRIFLLSNGTLIRVATANSATINNRVLITLLLNGGKSKKIGRDIFLIELGGGAGSGTNKNKFYPYGFISSYSCQTYLTMNSSNACNKNKNGQYCFAYILCNGWQIDDEYPW